VLRDDGEGAGDTSRDRMWRLLGYGGHVRDPTVISSVRCDETERGMLLCTANHLFQAFRHEPKHVFGSATAVLYRADLVGTHGPFYNEGNFHADVELCFTLLGTRDCGSVRQVL
jgi:hypothetical protein